MITTPNQKYQQLSVQTASPAQLTLMLFDGAIRFSKLGVQALEERNLEKSNLYLLKAQKIINELLASLNREYPISDNLAVIYEYMLHNLINGNIKKNAKPVEETIGHLLELRESWLHVVKTSNQESQTS
ncbi:flagellar export chaperone FliS [Paenibacillaceae bacterium WGS1546]|uniref:flagellar export chaperone FliS n=1 Tax=Cohnella sp. WGS1546 TaxID=3366810 RepID=UPI00372D0A77